MIKTIPIIIAIYIGLLNENIPRAIKRIPISKTRIDENDDSLVILDINPPNPKIIIINPTI